MSSLEDFYASEENQAQRAKAPAEMERYNTHIRVYREVTAEILASIRKNPPKRYEWVEVGGRRLVGWQFYRDYDFTYYLYFLSDGRLVSKNMHNGSLPDQVVTRVIRVEPLSKPMNGHELYAADRITPYNLHEVCQRLLTGGLHTFGLSGHPNNAQWYRAIQK